MKPTLRNALDERGYTTLTPVQNAVLDSELEGRDLLVSAQTGSGKTLAFGLAIAPELLGEADRFDAAAAPVALVIAPTRELAMQVKRELAWLYEKAGGVVTSCVGGMDMRDERRALARGAHIVAATPGRLRDHIMRGSIDVSQIQAVVLDEADEMLDLGFREELEFILGEVPQERRTLLFSATVPAAITQLAKRYQNEAQRVVVKSEDKQHADIEYRAMMVAERDIDNAVINTLRFYEAPNAIVFANTRAMVSRLATRLSNRGFRAVALSGELTQTERTHALQAMRDGRAQVCVATDVAARGIDLPKLDLVVHAELPTNHETLLHRSGRTGRAGRKGVSALIVTGKSRKKAERILKFARLTAEWGDAPSAEAVEAQDEMRLFADPVWNEAVAESEQALVEKLTTEFSALQLASAYVRLRRAQRSAPEELSSVDAKPAPRAPFGPSVWFAISGGRTSGAEPRRLLPMLCKAGGLSKEDIGAIRVRADQSFVQVLEASAPRLLSAVGDGGELEAGAVLQKLDEAPDLGADKTPARGAPKRRESGDRPAKRMAREDTRPRVKPEPVKSETADEGARREAVKSWSRPTLTAKGRDGGKAMDGGKGRERGKPRGGAKAIGSGKPCDGEQPPKRKNDGPKDQQGKLGRKPKGPPPPAGKPSSKKNRARRAMASGKPGKMSGKGKRSKDT